jgi:hypothetical protein
MSAVKVIFKRSSVLGKRPTGANLEAGEIGLNTNSNDPGLFFEVNDGSVVKAGPTAYLPQQPTVTPALGELWVDSDTKGLSIGNGAGQWQKVAAPFLGGTNGLTVFVAPEYQNATDSLANDGQTVPFRTINRAILEITKQIVLEANSRLSEGNNRYQIILAPGRHCVVNGPGSAPTNFSTVFNTQFEEVTQQLLQSFNPVTGGLLLPRGVSIVGLDLKKCEIHPTYVPHYTHPSFPANYQQDRNGGPIYQNDPLSSVFKWSGNTYCTQFNAQDKVFESIVVGIRQNNSGTAVFRTERPHGLSYNDFVKVTYTNSADQAAATFSPGPYYAYPLNSYEFEIASQSWDVVTTVPVPTSSLPSSFVGSADSPKFTVQSIYPYYIPPDGVSYELSNYSHHRLSVLKNASLQELNDFYIKVQQAFPNVFGNTVNRNVVSIPETQIVANTDGVYPNNVASNNTDNSSPYQNSVNHRSNYGMANGDYDGTLVSGFKSVIINASTAVILQKDPAAYEVYANSAQQWRTLTAQLQQQLTGNLPITSIPLAPQLQELNTTSIPNIRYYYETIKLQNGKSTGISNPEYDFRHFGFRLSGPNSFMQAQSTYSIGAAIAVWAREGALISLTNATTNFGSVAFEAEGFAGIGTLGGANAINRGFLQEGIVRPLALTEVQVVSDNQKRILPFGSKVVHVGPDPDSPGVQLLFLQDAFDPSTILPFSLKPDSAVFVEDGQCVFRAFFVTNGEPTCVLSETNPIKNPYALGGAILRVRSSDSNIPNGPTSVTCLQIPYIRRFIDPRTPAQKSYGFYVTNSNPTSQAPQLGSVLRLNQTGQNLSTSIKRNYQFDPGQFGGIAQVFTVDLVEAYEYNKSLNYNNKISNITQSTAYTVYSSLSDASSPWVQSVQIQGTLEPFNHPRGSYITYANRNYFAAENDLWSDLYYRTTFNYLNGPTKVSPNKIDSPYVTTSVLQRQEPIDTSWQGYVPDPFYAQYIAIPDPYKTDLNLSYMRGAVVPYQDFDGSFLIDMDDSTSGMGIIYTRDPIGAAAVTTFDSVVAQPAVSMTTPYVSPATFGQPELLTLSMLQVSQIVNPKNGLSVVRLTNSSIAAAEYCRVIGIRSNTITVIRNYYPEYALGTLPAVWPAGTTVTVCFLDCTPEPMVYDPIWSVTKATMFRYFQLMGYSSDVIAPYLVPRFSGERLLLNANINLSPIDGYAARTAAWPVEFNNPSSILANTHTWQYAGYFDYSRGLPQYQVNEISRKLQFDFYSTASWGGRLTVVGADQQGSLIFLGPLREALTGNYYPYNNPSQNFNDRITRETPPPVDNYPTPILVYSADDISALFDGAQTSFDLLRGGLPIPISQLDVKGMFVTVGGVMQIPDIAYVLAQTGGVTIPVIQFSSPPPAGASCDIRIVTSDDNKKTLEVISYTQSPSFDGVQSTFTLAPSATGITNENSFIYLSGVAQTPQGSGHPGPAYTITNTTALTTLSYIGGIPPAGLLTDYRAIVSGSGYRAGSYELVNVISVDDISVFFNNATTSFPLYVNNLPLNPDLVNSENMFVTLGAVIQIPHNVAGNPLSGNAYTVQVNPITKLLEITFAAPPLLGTSCTIRVVSSEPKDLIICPLPPGLANQPLRPGDGVEANEDGEITRIDPGLIF